MFAMIIIVLTKYDATEKDSLHMQYQDKINFITMERDSLKETLGEAKEERDVCKETLARKKREHETFDLILNDMKQQFSDSAKKSQECGVTKAKCLSDLTDAMTRYNKLTQEEGELLAQIHRYREQNATLAQQVEENRKLYLDTKEVMDECTKQIEDHSLKENTTELQ